MGRPAKKLKDDRMVSIKFNKPCYVTDDPDAFETDSSFKKVGSMIPAYKFNMGLEVASIAKNDEKTGKLICGMGVPGNVITLPYSKAKKYLDAKVKCNYIEGYLITTDVNDSRIKKLVPVAEIVETVVIETEVADEETYENNDTEEALSEPSL